MNAYPLYVQALVALCGALWCASYLLLIRQAARDRTPGMPLAPLCVNVAWELVYGFIHPDLPPASYANRAWFVIDLVILWQLWRYGRDELPPIVPRRWWSAIVAGGVIAGLLAVLALHHDLHDEGGTYSGWGDQLLLSASCVAMLLRRQRSAGQSMYIGITRALGSLVLIPAQHAITPHARTLWLIYALFPILDVLYLSLLYRQCLAEGRDPWDRAAPTPTVAAAPLSGRSDTLISP
jgi:hypothetical protein